MLHGCEMQSIEEMTGGDAAETGRKGGVGRRESTGGSERERKNWQIMEERKMRLRGGTLMNNLLANIKGKVEHERGSEEAKHVGSGV